MASAMTLRALFCILGVAMVGIYIYPILVVGHPFHEDVFTAWFLATLIDLWIINGILIGAWVSYKESSWVTTLIWIMFLICFQSVTVCVYIVLQLSKLSAEESSDPVYNVLLRRSSKNPVETKRYVSISAAKVIFFTLSCPVVGLAIWAFVMDGFPIAHVLEPFMTAILLNFYVTITPILIWVSYKESSWLSASIWIFMMMLMGSTPISAYIVRQLFYLSPQDPIHLILFNSSNRKSETTKPLLGDVESVE